MTSVSDIDTRDVLFVALLAGIIALSGLAYLGHFNTSYQRPEQVSDLFTPKNPATIQDEPEKGWFADTTTEAGLQTRNTGNVTYTGPGEGYGVYVADYNVDGYPDLLFLGSDPMLYRNENGIFTPIDIFEGYSDPQKDIAGAHFLDYDTDGDKDLFIAREDRRSLLFTHGEDGWVTPPEELDITITDGQIRSIASADYDRDGCLDIYIGVKNNRLQRTPAQQEDFLERNLAPSTMHTYVNGDANLLLQGDCSGTFEAVSMGDDVQRAYHTNAVSFVDLNGDDLPDIHAGNDWGPDMIYLNEGDGTFQPRLLGPSTARNAMSSVITDFNGDQRPDIFVTNVHAGNRTERTVQWAVDNSFNSIAGNNVLVNAGNGSFTDQADRYGLAEGGVGWAAAITDLNNNGHREVLHATSAGHDIPYYRIQKYSYPQLWNGTGTTDRFVKHPARRAGFHITNGRGLAALDYNRDGLQDVVIGSRPVNLMKGSDIDRGHTLTLYTNQLQSDDDFLGIQLDYESRLETGSTIFLHTDRRTRMETINSKADYRSQQSQIAHFGLEDDETIESIEVERPDGTIRRYDAIERGRYHRINGTHVIPRQQ